jgi:hypothetical protein
MKKFLHIGGPFNRKFKPPPQTMTVDEALAQGYKIMVINPMKMNRGSGLLAGASKSYQYLPLRLQVRSHAHSVGVDIFYESSLKEEDVVKRILQPK